MCPTLSLRSRISAASRAARTKVRRKRMHLKSKFLASTLFCLVAGGLGYAQGPGPGPMTPGGPDGPGGPGGFGRPPMEHTFHDEHFGRWWNNPRLAQAVGLTDDQKKKMDDIFQQHRLKLVDLHANLEKLEIVMRPMIEADNPNEAQVLAQIDKIAQARADLEKADAHMLFEIRKVLTADQWQKLKAWHEQHRGEMMRRDDRGRTMIWRQHRGGPDGAGPGNAPPPPAPQGD